MAQPASSGPSETVILYPPQFEALAKNLGQSLGTKMLLCTCNLAACPADQSGEAVANNVAVFWDTFPSASGERDPNVKVLHTALVGKHVVVLLSQDDTTNSFAQLSLVLWLQRFLVPTADDKYASGKWKDTVHDGAFSVASVASLSIVIPWYRFCQMERTSRWTRTADAAKPWDNKQSLGQWLDIPTAQVFASLLSADPPPVPLPSTAGAPSVPPLPPKQLLLIDIHDDLKGVPVIESTLAGSGKWANPTKPYDLPTGTGTYFASAFHSFLNTSFAKSVSDVSSAFVVFPDVGAFRRFEKMVLASLPGIAPDHVLFIEKSRTGTQISQSDNLYYHDASGTKCQRETLPASASVLIPDDFTNSGSTLFGAGTIVRKHAAGSLTVAAFVTHFVAKYERAVVDKFVAKLYSEGDTKSDLDAFYTCDTVACSVAWLQEEVAKRTGPPRATVFSIAPVLASWLMGHHTAAAADSISGIQLASPRGIQ